MGWPPPPALPCSPQRMTFECFSHPTRPARWDEELARYVKAGPSLVEQPNKRWDGRRWVEGAKTCAVFLVQEQRIHPPARQRSDTRYPGELKRTTFVGGDWVAAFIHFVLCIARESPALSHTNANARDRSQTGNPITQTMGVARGGQEVSFTLAPFLANTKIKTTMNSFYNSNKMFPKIP